MDEGSKYSNKYADIIDSVYSEIGFEFKFGWNFVRSLGELQVLTRASYIMLIVVPLLAGLWPGVTVVVNRFNDSVITATQKLEIASDKLELFIKSNSKVVEESPTINTITNSLKEDISTIHHSIEEASIESKEMPDVWVWVFLSALTAILAHTIYQVAAPSIIRQASEREYINIRIDEEIKIQGKGADLKVVVMDSRREYELSSQSRKIFSLISFLLYLGSMTMIAIVIESQTRSVLTQAGWI